MAGVGAKPKLTKAEQSEVVEYLRQGLYTQKTLAVMYRVSISTIGRIAKDEDITSKSECVKEMPQRWKDDWESATKNIRTCIAREKKHKLAKVLEGRR